jgi:hypothetical protein
MSDALTYRIQSNLLSPVQPDSTGQWDMIREYSSGDVFLANLPGTPWYSSSDTNLSFEIELSALWVKTRGLGDPFTNPNPAYIEMEVAAHAGRFVCLATYAGTPCLTNFPETPWALPSAMATAPLSWARFCIGSAIENSGVPLSISGMLTGSSQVELSWNSSTNGLYQLQCCSDLAGNVWTDFGIPMIGTGTTNRAADAVEPGTAQRFYRILKFP